MNYLIYGFKTLTGICAVCLFSAGVLQASDESPLNNFTPPQIGFAFEDGLKPAYFIETVYKLYQDAERDNTVFLQPRLNYSDAEKDYYNLGIGWRHYLNRADALAGVNLFTDFERENRHGRIGLGGEYLSVYFDARVNAYWALSKRRRVEQLGEYVVFEQALDGWDAEAGFPLPGLPGLKWFAGAEAYDYKHRQDSLAWRTRLEWSLSPAAFVDIKVTDDEVTKPQWSIELRFSCYLEDLPKWHLNPQNYPVNADIRQRALERVRRESRIRKEKFAEGAFSFVVVKA